MVAGAVSPEANAGAEPKMPGFVDGAMLGILPSSFPDAAAALLPPSLARLKALVEL